MTKTDLDFNPTTHITIDAIGEPGKRVFYLQGSHQAQQVSLLLDKAQVQMLALGVEQFMQELEQKFPHLSKALPSYDEKTMSITPPIDPLFRVSELSLGYDTELDLMVLIARQESAIKTDEETPAVVRFWCTRSQMWALARWAAELISRGLPVWPSSGEPILSDKEFSPKNNGHKK